RADRGDVRTRARLRHADAGDEIACDRGRKKFPAQLLGTEARESGRRHVGLHADRHRHAAAIDVARRLVEDGAIGIIEPRTAIGLRLGDTEQAEIAHLLENLMGRKNLRLFPFINVRIDFLVDEFTNGAPQFFMFAGQFHGRFFPLHAAAEGGIGRHPFHGPAISRELKTIQMDCFVAYSPLKGNVPAVAGQKFWISTECQNNAPSTGRKPKAPGRAKRSAAPPSIAWPTTAMPKPPSTGSWSARASRRARCNTTFPARKT